MKDGKNPPNKFTLYSVHRNHVEWLCGITPTPYHECSRSHQLCTMNDRGHINSVLWMYAVTITPYHEWPGSHQLRTMNARSLSTPSSYFHSDQLRTFMVRRFCKVALRSTKIRIKWLWPVKVTLEIIKRRLLVFCWSCDEIPLKWEEKKFPSLQFMERDWMRLLLTPPGNGRSMPLTFFFIFYFFFTRSFFY